MKQEKYLLRVVTPHIVCGVTFDEEENILRKPPYLGFLKRKNLKTLDDIINWADKSNYQYQLIEIGEP